MLQIIYKNGVRHKEYVLGESDVERELKSKECHQYVSELDIDKLNQILSRNEELRNRLISELSK